MPLRILLADDSMTAQNMGKKILTDAGYEVTAVSNGAAAAKKLGEKFDVIILDVFMPGYSGLEICEKIRASMDSAKTPVLLTVGKMEPYNPQDGQRVKADGVIIKPFEATDLLAAVKKLEQQAAAAAAAAAASAPKPDFEKTMVFKAPLAKEFQDETYHSWKVDVPHTEAEQPEEQEMPVAAPMPTAEPGVPAFAMDEGSFPVSSSGAAAAPAFEMPGPSAAFEMPTSAPAFSMEEPAASPTFELPANVAAAFDLNAAPSAETMNIAPPSPAMGFPPIEETAPSAPPAFSMEFSAPEAAAPAFSMDETASIESMVEPTSAAAVDVPSYAAPAPEVEFTAAPKVGSIEVQADPSLDVQTEQPPSGFIAMSGPDPALVTDPHEMTTAFATKFGVDNDDEPVVVGTPMAAPAEETVEAAPAMPVPVETSEVETVQDETTAVETGMPEHANGAGTADDEFEARLAAAMSSFDTPEVSGEAAVAEEPAPYAAAEETAEMAAVVEPEPLESNEAEEEPPAVEDPEPEPQTHIEDPLPEPEAEPVSTAAESTEPEPIIPEPDPSTQPPDGMLDAALVEQLQAAVADMQVQEHPPEDHMEPEPVTAVAPEPEATAPEPVGANSELANALEASLGGEPTGDRMAMAAAASAGTSMDPIVLTGVVNKVLERMLPMIFSQIAAELERMKK